MRFYLSGSMLRVDGDLQPCDGNVTESIACFLKCCTPPCSFVLKLSGMCGRGTRELQTIDGKG